jgi:hypothetical protein
MGAILITARSKSIHGKTSHFVIQTFRNYKDEQLFQRKGEIPFIDFIMQRQFCLESFQNWQSEFIAVNDSSYFHLPALLTGFPKC